jgi:hypothetical protein
VQHSTDRTAGNERNAQHGLEPLLAEERVHDIGAIEIFQNDRLSRRCDPSGEPCPDRDAQAAIDLFFETGSGA